MTAEGVFVGLYVGDKEGAPDGEYDGENVGAAVGSMNLPSDLIISAFSHQNHVNKFLLMQHFHKFRMNLM